MRAPATPTMPALTEAQFARQVYDLAALTGWSFVHFRPARTAHGWRTPVEGSLGAGFPDLILAHPHRQQVLFIELKTERGRLSPAQEEVHDFLRAAGADVRTWRPSDLPAIQEALTTT